MSTILGDKDSMYVADRKVAHKELCKTWLVCHLLIHCPALTRNKKNGCSKNVFDITITLSENGKSVTIPYNSFDFDDGEKYYTYNIMETLQPHFFLED